MSEVGSGGAAAPTLAGKRASPPAGDVRPRTDVASPPRKKKQKTNGSSRALTNPPAINQSYLEDRLKDSFGSALRDNTETSDSGTDACVLNTPFTCCVLPDFVRDETFLTGLKEELLDLDFNNKSNDLYKFQQSDALQNYSSPYISALKKLLYKDFLSWLREVTGIPFIDTFDLTCSKYSYTDVLLCHDDELEGRRVAFILYLVPPWTQEDGGLLDLFDMDAHGQPRSIVKSLVPKWNNFVFFEVNPKSFHQVSEVVNPDKCRLSVNGWFHGPSVPRPPPYIEPRHELTPHVNIQESLFFDWISEQYLDLNNQGDVQDMFSDESEIQLAQFFEKEKSEEVHHALQSPDIRWTRRGPANKRSYESADLSTLPAVVRECLSVMQSEYVFLLLSNFTHLRLHEQAMSSDDENEDEREDEKEEEEEEKEEEEGEMEGKADERTIKKQSETSADAKECIEEEGEQEGDGSRTKDADGNHGDGDGDAKEEKVRTEGEEGVINQREPPKGGENSSGNGAADSDLENGVVRKLTPKPSMPRCRAEIRRWSHGCYTLLHDTDTEGSEFALDASVFFNTQGLDQKCGGFVSYIAKEEDEELLSVLPEDNSLSLVYRDKETLRFVKHINHSFLKARGGEDGTQHSQTTFYELYLVYYE